VVVVAAAAAPAGAAVVADAGRRAGSAAVRNDSRRSATRGCGKFRCRARFLSATASCKTAAYGWLDPAGSDALLQLDLSRRDGYQLRPGIFVSAPR